MIRLLYFSLAAPTITSEDHHEILASARRNNKKRDLTGVLVTGGGVFLQVLEGPQQSVLSLYLKIREDKRHSDVEIMRVTPIINRIFGDWLMASVEATPLEFEQIMKFKLDHFAFDEPKEFVETMHGIKKLLKEQSDTAGVSSQSG